MVQKQERPAIGARIIASCAGRRWLPLYCLLGFPKHTFFSPEVAMPKELPPRPKKVKGRRKNKVAEANVKTMWHHADAKEEKSEDCNLLPSGKARDPWWKYRGRRGKRDLLRAIACNKKMLIKRSET